jgi:FtsZ-interacting cell division protein ZipA
MLRTIVNIIAAIAVIALVFLGMVKAGSWYLDTEAQQVRDGIKDPRTAILPVIER